MLLKYIKLYIEFAKQNLKTMLEYRVEFIIGAMSTLLSQLVGISFLWIIFQNIQNINGWSFYEMTLVYGMLVLSASLNHLFFDNLWVLGVQYVREGKFDILLLRPISPLFHLVANKIQQDGLGSFIVGTIIVTKSLHEINIPLSISSISLLILFIISGAAIFSAINLITCISSFWIINSNLFMWSIFSTNQFALYPLTIYHKYIRVIITLILPYAFASFYPANYFLHKGYEHLSLLSPIVAVILWIIALKVWSFGIKHYASTGS